MFRLQLVLFSCGTLVAASGGVERADTLFRQGAFDDAATAYRAALTADPGNARAWWGLGRIASLEFRRQEAHDFFARAFGLDPSDPKIAAAYTSSQDAPLGRLASPYREYNLKLSGFRPVDSAAAGMMLTVRLNGDKPLHLVLDTGARGIVVHARAARDAHLSVWSESEVGGIGGESRRSAQTAIARRLAIGDLEYRDCRVEIASAAIAPGADGVIGTTVFRDFAIVIDPFAMSLQLRPERASVSNVPAYDLDGLLIVKASINRDREGLFLIDTGAAFSSVESGVVRHRTNSRAPLTVSGAQGMLPEAFRVSPVSFDIGGRTMVDPAAIAIDLSRVSEQEDVEISGLLGFSLLGRARLTLDYRNGVVRLGR